MWFLLLDNLVTLEKLNKSEKLQSTLKERDFFSMKFSSALPSALLKLPNLLPGRWSSPEYINCGFVVRIQCLNSQLNRSHKARAVKPVVYI